MEAYKVKCKKINILDATKQYIYDEEYGIAFFIIAKATFKTKENPELQSDQIYKKVSNRFETLGKYDLIDFLRNEEWDKEDFYISDPNRQDRNSYYDYYYRGGVLVAGREKVVKIQGINLYIRLNYFVNNQNSNSVSKTIVFTSKKELLAYNVLSIEDFDWQKLRKPFLRDIEKGKMFYYVGKGTVEVTEVYDFPQRNNIYCKVKDKKGSLIDIYYSCDQLYHLPFEKTENILKRLDQSKNELSLQPYVIKEGNTFNVYWKSITEAAEYRISLYKIIEYDGRKDLYHLKDYCVERNENLLVVDNLIGNNFVFKVIAENREGKMIAESRGIVQKYPMYFVEDDD